MCVHLYTLIYTHHFLPDALAVLAKATATPRAAIETSTTRVQQDGMDEEEKDIEDEPVQQRIRKIVSVPISSFPIHFHISISILLCFIFFSSIILIYHS